MVKSHPEYSGERYGLVAVLSRASPGDVSNRCCVYQVGRGCRSSAHAPTPSPIGLDNPITTSHTLSKSDPEDCTAEMNDIRNPWLLA